MESKNKLIELIAQQGQNVLESMKDLKRKAKKKGKERSDLYERFNANQHSFSVYTYIDPSIEQLAEVQAFEQKVDLFRAEFACVVTNPDSEVNVKNAETTFEVVLTAYNKLVNALEHKKS